MNWIYPALAIACLAAAVFSVLFAGFAGADIDRRGRNVILGGLVAAAIFFVAFVCLAVIAYSKYFGS